MNSSNHQAPVVLCFSGLDPSGGAGIQADIETLASLGCHCAPVITALTAQDTVNVKDVEPVVATLLVEQARAVLEDMPVAAIKIGMLGSVQAVEAIHTILTDYEDIPVILDPVLAAGGGTQLATEQMVTAIRHLLLPHVELLTPNSEETRQLCREADSLDASAVALMDKGCEHVLITGTHEKTAKVVNQLWGKRIRKQIFDCERLPNEYHGSGCTLASAIAAYIAHGTDVVTAVRNGLSFTWESLSHGHRLGMGQHIPNRLFWAQNDGCKQSKSAH